MPSLRIGVNALYLIPGGVGGTEIYLRGVLRALGEIDGDNRYFLFTNRETGMELGPKQPNFEIVKQRVSAKFRPARILWEQTVLPFEAWRLRLDVLFNPGFTAPICCPCPQVTVFHDMQHTRHPEHFRWFDLPFWRLLLWASARRSKLLLADSDSTGDDLLRFYRLARGKVRVVPLGVDPEFSAIAERRCPDRERPYLLCVSTLHPHKNLEMLLEAFAEFRTRRPDVRLMVAGLRGFHTKPLERLRSSLGLEDHVVFTGWIPRAELIELYRRATAFVYPSTFEGFGLPVLEAMAAGIPTACSSIEPLASMAGTAAVQFDPANRRALVEAMTALVSDEALRARLAVEGRARATAFSWRQTGVETLRALRDAAS